MPANESAPALFMTSPRATSGARISDCGRYRYLLWREWDPTLPKVVFVMLNPSTADAEQDDPTIRRCIRFAKSWGGGRLEVVNLYAWRATDPGQLPAGREAIGPDNDRTIQHLCLSWPLTVAAWGAHPMTDARARYVTGLLGGQPVRCLGRTAKGGPRHPLYVRADKELEVYSA